MFRELWTLLSQWEMLDTWIVVTGALAAAACALPGNYLVLRRQSLMGDALSHTVLPGIVVAFLASHALTEAGWIRAGAYSVVEQQILFAGALILGLMTAVLTEAVRRLGQVEASAALGVVFTSLFAVGLLLIRVAADTVHIDPDCVLYGAVETAWMETWGQTGIPQAVVYNGLIVLLNALLIILFYKELQVSTFDPALADTLGVSSRTMHYCLMSVTAATLVAAFESVGSILVVAMLIVPAATAYLLADRLRTMLLLSVVFAVFSAVLGHALAITLPAIVFGRLGFPAVQDASTAGMMAVAAGLVFVVTLLMAPRQGILSRVYAHWALSLKIAREDLLGLLFRLQETHSSVHWATVEEHVPWLFSGGILRRVAVWQLRHRGLVQGKTDGLQLTEPGRRAAESVVRSHRLWESYMSQHFALPDDHLHATAARVEHFLDQDLINSLADELEHPGTDPHGRVIPDRSATREASPEEPPPNPG